MMRLHFTRPLRTIHKSPRTVRCLIVFAAQLVFLGSMACSPDAVFSCPQSSDQDDDGLFPSIDDLAPSSGRGNSPRSPRSGTGVDDTSLPLPRTRSPRTDSDLSTPLDPVPLDSESEFELPGRKLPWSGVRDRSQSPGVFEPPFRNPLPDQAIDNESSDIFDWTQQTLSIADLEIGKDWVFQHGKPSLTEAEEENYVSMIRAVMDRRTLTPSQVPAWETAFYRFAEVRKQAWQNGKIRLQRSMTGLADPFAPAGSKLLSTADGSITSRELTRYSLQADMQSNPEQFVGRPVVLYGLFTPSGPKELQAQRTLEGEERIFTLQRGMLTNLRDPSQTIAMLDAISFVDPQSQKVESAAWPVEKRVAIPVMVKGWFVKLWHQQPLIFTDVVRVLTPRPYDDYIRDHVRSRRKVTDDESWLYHETLRQLQVTSGTVQAGLALAEQKLRMKELHDAFRAKLAMDRRSLEEQYRSGQLKRTDNGNEEGYETLRRRLERQLSVRENRYQIYQRDPDSYPLYVDVFQNPSRWQGRLVTFKGHVRRVTTYEGDSALFDGQPLHELWLFTDDSQQNPTVIVTPSLPKDFPVTASLVDSVAVTGCFFKMYVYRSQQENRLAPLVLAGHVTWAPTAEHVISLAKDGHLPAGSALVLRAKSESRPVSDTMLLLLGFVTLIAAMTVWGRVQRDRRERRRMLALVDERPDFRQTSQDLFSGPFADSRIEPTRG